MALFRQNLYHHPTSVSCFDSSKMTKEQNVGTARLSAFSPAKVTEEGYTSFAAMGRIASNAGGGEGEVDQPHHGCFEELLPAGARLV